NLGFAVAECDVVGGHNGIPPEAWSHVAAVVALAVFFQHHHAEQTFHASLGGHTNATDWAGISLASGRIARPSRSARSSPRVWCRRPGRRRRGDRPKSR